MGLRDFVQLEHLIIALNWLPNSESGNIRKQNDDFNNGKSTKLSKKIARGLDELETT